MNVLITLLDDATLEPRTHLIVHRSELVVAIAAEGDDIDEARIRCVIGVVRKVEQRFFAAQAASTPAAAVSLVKTQNGEVPATPAGAREAAGRMIVAAVVAAVIIGGMWLHSLL